MPRRFGVLPLLALAVTAGACGGSASGSPTTTASSAAAVTTDGATGDATTTSRPARSTTTTDRSVNEPTTTAAGGPEADTGTVGDLAEGNQILMIGDSILAATATRYGGAMCRELVPRGWQVLLEAEVSRPIDFAAVVQRSARAGLPEVTWDAGLVFLGTNFFGSSADYLRKLDRAVAFFGDVPVVLVTITEHDERIPSANRAIEAVAQQRPNVSIIDWRTITAERPELLISDGIHPTERGRSVLIDLISERLGDAPTRPGRCLGSTFVVDEPLAEGVMPTTTAPRSGTGTTTTVRVGTTTTTPMSGSSPTTTGVTTSRPTTTMAAPPNTPAPTTVPPTTPPPMPTATAAPSAVPTTSPQADPGG